MKTKIKSVEYPFYGKYQENQLITFDYFGRDCSAVVTRNARNKLKVHNLIEGQEIQIVKNIKNQKIVYVVTKVY